MVNNREVINGLTDINDSLSRSINNIEDIVSRTAMGLRDCLSNNNLFIEDKIKNKLNNIVNNLGRKKADIEKNIERIEKQLPNIDNKNKAQFIEKIENYQTIKSNIEKRLEEYQKLVERSGYFNDKKLDELDVNTKNTSGAELDLLPFVDKDEKREELAYKICDKDGSPIATEENSDGSFNFNLEIRGTTYTLRNIRIRLENHKLDFSSMKIEPELKSSPLETELSINAIFDSNKVGVDDINVVCNKKFKLKLNNGTDPLNNEASRGGVFESEGNRIISSINRVFERPRKTLEKEAFEKFMGKINLYNNLNDKQKEYFYKMISESRVPGENLKFFESALHIIDEENPRFKEFKKWFVSKDKEWNKKGGEHIKSDAEYKDFIFGDLVNKFSEFLSYMLDKFIEQHSEYLRNNLYKFCDEIEGSKDNTDPGIDVISDITERETHQIEDKKAWYEFWHSSDENYMRFLSGSSAELKGEVVNIDRSMEEPEPLKYDMNMEINGKNSIEVKIQIEGERNPFCFKSGDPAALIRMIMKSDKIKYLKAKAHMGFNIYKSMVKIAKDNDITLKYYNGDSIIKVDLDGDGDIFVKEINPLDSSEKIIFDQKRFKALNNYGELIEGIDQLGTHFSLVMNMLHRQYCDGIEKLSRSHLTTAFLGPIKKLLTSKNSRNLEIETEITSKGKTIKIKYTDGKFSVQIDSDRPIESDDLGKILKKRKHGIRVFDGMERDIVAGFYSELIDQIRDKIGNKTFGVMDNITGNIYILDQDGFSIIKKGDLETNGNPLGKKGYGKLSNKKLKKYTITELTEDEQKELMKNPFLMQRFIKAM